MPARQALLPLFCFARSYQWIHELWCNQNYFAASACYLSRLICRELCERIAVYWGVSGRNNGRWHYSVATLPSSLNCKKLYLMKYRNYRPAVNVSLLPSLPSSASPTWSPQLSPQSGLSLTLPFICHESSQSVLKLSKIKRETERIGEHGAYTATSIIMSLCSILCRFLLALPYQILFTSQLPTVPLNLQDISF
jgi:hypothetical protein